MLSIFKFKKKSAQDIQDKILNAVDDIVKDKSYWDIKYHVEQIIFSQVSKKIEQFFIEDKAFKDELAATAQEHCKLILADEKLKEMFRYTCESALRSYGYGNAYNEAIRKGFEQHITNATQKALGIQ